MAPLKDTLKMVAAAVSDDDLATAPAAKAASPKPAKSKQAKAKKQATKKPKAPVLWAPGPSVMRNWRVQLTNGEEVEIRAVNGQVAIAEVNAGRDIAVAGRACSAICIDPRP